MKRCKLAFKRSFSRAVLRLCFASLLQMVPFSPLDDCIDSEDDMTGSEQQVKDDDKDDHVDQQVSYDSD